MRWKIYLIIWIAFWPAIEPAGAQSIFFEDASETAGVYTGEGSHGIAVADYDNDGWDDIYLAVRGGGSVLLRNNQDGTFENVTGAVGVAVPGEAVNPLWGDLNNDGFLDLFVGTRHGELPGRLFVGSSSGTFRDISEEAGINLSAPVGSAALGDYDNDGKLDLFIATRDMGDLLYRNVSDSPEAIRFEDVSQRASVAGPDFSIAMQATWIDIDQDDDLDLFAVHDGNLPSRIYQNLSFLPLIDSSYSSDLKVARSAMGVAWGDYNNDGYFDVYVTNIGRGNLFRNNGKGAFEDVTGLSGAGQNGMSWGVVFADFDNDGDEDLFIGNTYGYDQSKSFLYENRAGTFVNIAEEAHAALSTNTYGVSMGDFDNDGRMDLIIASESGKNRLLLNRTELTGNWIELSLIGGSTNATAVGATIRLMAGDKTLYRTITAGSSYTSQVSPRIHFGLGDEARIDELEVIWGPGESQLFTDLVVNKHYTLHQNQPINVHMEDERMLNESGFTLGSYPNPASHTTFLNYTIQESGQVTISLYDVQGREVRVLVDAYRPRGVYQERFEVSHQANGMYILRMITDQHPSVTTKLMVNR